MQLTYGKIYYTKIQQFRQIVNNVSNIQQNTHGRMLVLVKL